MNILEQYVYTKKSVFGYAIQWLLICLLAGCNQQAMEQVSGPTMGTTYQVKYITGDSNVSQPEVAQRVDAVLADINQRMSTYITTSELMQFNQAPTGEVFKLSNDIVTLVALSQEISEMSGGRYDVTVGPLVNLWGFGPDKRPTTVPSDEVLAEAFANVGYHYVKADKQASTLVKEKPVFVDLSSIAKGYAVDKVAEALDSMGINSYLVEVGGELKVKGEKAAGVPWRIGIEEPVLGQRKASAAIEAPGKGIATSGDYRNYYEIDGQRFSHTINPLTGHPITHKLASVTVVHPSVAMADGLATMLMVVGYPEGMALAKEHDLAAYFIVKEGEGFTSYASPGFKAYLTSDAREE
ncbi:FAD:protein FMN transferase [Zooshikella harenae]|uniref:FAD:protein FMN transferase n=1 Tax=Zooshikella harenae TaxID=2827238 RepID=A0ABS5ZF20_9GAMM|nr:FAD:protein FMN transferase [Zooshikella harenae]MBU2711567.1 FAD:protein FMN transferase [Zooshikella harenae]